MNLALRDEPNPLYYLVVLASVLWLVSLGFPVGVVDADTAYYINLGVFAVWAVLPVAMAFDVGILRLRFDMRARYCVPLIVLSAIPLVAPFAGGAYVVYRSRVVAETRR